MKYTKPASQSSEIHPMDTVCSGMKFTCTTWQCDGVWRCNSTWWSGCSKKYTV